MSKRILVIDDRPDLSYMVQCILKEEGFEALLRGIPFQDVMEVEALNLDLIILAVTDIVDCIGRQTLKLLRAHPSHTPVLVLVREPWFRLEQDQKLKDERTLFVRSPSDIEGLLEYIQQALK